MEKIGDILKMPKQKRAPSEYATLLGEITDTLNAERRGTKFPRLTYGRMAKTLAGMQKQDLYYILSVFKDKRYRGESCGKWFFWAVKAQPETLREPVSREPSGLSTDTT